MSNTKKKPTKQNKSTSKKEEKKPGVIDTIATTISGSGKKGVTKEEILEVLVKQFPERNPEGMKNTINAQLPTRISSRLKVERTEEGTYRKA